MDDAIVTDALEDVAYLSRSENRVRILDAVQRRPATRRELAERTGTSRTTLDRIVTELEDRGWVERTTDGEYAATPVGAVLLRQFRPFLGAVAAIDRLGDAVTWLPVEDLSVGLEHFADATVMRPEHDAVEVIEYMDDLIRESDRFLVLSDLVPPERIGQILHESVTEGGLAVTAVATGQTVDLIRGEPRRRERWREMVEAGAEITRYEGSIPCNLWIADETVLIKESAEEPIPESYGRPIVSENEAVRSWGADLIERHAAAGTPLTAASFADDSTVATSGPGDR